MKIKGKLYKIKKNSFTLFLIILIIPFTTMINIDDYSIDEFKYLMEREGLFDIILSIKNVYGQDVAIISCEELNKDNCGNCEKLVVDYMPNRNINHNSQVSKLRNFMKHSKDTIIDQKNLEMKSIIKNIIKIKFNPEESEYFANKIVERADISI